MKHLQRYARKPARIFMTLALVAGFMGLFGTGAVPPAQAASCCPNLPICSVTQNRITRALESRLHAILREHITQEFLYQERWFMYDYFQEYILPGLMNMVEQVSTVGEMQVMAFGVLMDAKEQLEAQRLLQEKMAEAHRDYRPDMNMCTIGTAARGLAAQDRNAESMANALTKRMIDRQLGVQYTSGAEGKVSDAPARIEQFRRRFCDRHSNGGNTSNICLAAASGPHINRDIDYSATLGLRRTVNLDLNNNSLAAPDSDDENIMALASNLYGNRVFEVSQTPNTDMTGDEGRTSGAMAWYLDKRAVTAKRSVAMNSFNEIAGMKARGTASAATAGNYLQAVFQQLGVASEDEARQMLGSNPSYYAQLEIMAQKIYQDPEFFTNLYDSPTNVMRKNVAMQAINLMLDRDTFKSELRTEALLSQMLELELIRYQRAMANRLNQMKSQSAPGLTR
ncbi:MAG TPA: hypothetical protein VGD95_00665 [Micavibrio sp.]